MDKSIMELVAEAKAAVPAIGADEAAAAMGRDDVVIVDVREDGEVAELGIIKGAIHASRGMIEFRADETSPMHHPSFSKDKTIILYCATGGRAALAGRALMELGYGDVRNLGAFKDWADGGGAVEGP
jgi:rhodanese-related sulfurtransferase